LSSLFCHANIFGVCGKVFTEEANNEKQKVNWFLFFEVFFFSAASKLYGVCEFLLLTTAQFAIIICMRKVSHFLWKIIKIVMVAHLY
jgi:hypothetical protein